MSTNTNEDAIGDEVLDFSDGDIADEAEEVEAEAAVRGGEETPTVTKVSDDPNPGNAAAGAVEGARSDTEEKEVEKEKIAAPYEYPTGIVTIDQLDMPPAMNAYNQWTPTPGIPGEPLENVTLALKFEAMGAQDLTVGLAHKRGGKGGMYQLIIGNKGNLQVDLEKRQAGRHVDTVASTAGLLCASKKEHKYWVAVKNGRIDFGVGDTCGQHTVISYQDAESPVEVRFAGFTCLRHRALFRNITMEAEAGGPLSATVQTELEFVRAEGCDEGFSGEDKASLDTALELYQRECDNMKRRARKFGSVYSPPFLQDWVPWTLVKRLSWNRDLEGGSIARARMNGRRGGSGPRGSEGAVRRPEAMTEAHRTPLAARVNPEVAEMMTDEKRHARSQKFSIPDQMWSIQAEEQGMRPHDIFCQDPDRADPEPMATTFPHKIHIFSLDKMVCKQIRDNDVKAYFEGFGPKYVEWLSDWSFNVVFEDAEEAKNAAAAKSFGLPDVLPEGMSESTGEEAVPDMGAMGWRLGVPMCKVTRDRWGPKGQWVRLLLRCAEAQDILLERPQTPAKPEGPVLRRASGSRLPPAVRVSQGYGGDERGDRQQRRGDGGGKRRRNDGGAARDEVMGQALKAPRTSNRRRESGSRSGGGGGGDGDEPAADAPENVVPLSVESSTPVPSTEHADTLPETLET